MYYPLFIDLKNKKALILGGGKIGSRRALYLLNAGAIVTVISKELDNKLLKIKNKNLKILIKDVKELEIDFKKYFLVVIATDSKKINDLISNKIKKTNKTIKNKILICRTDNHYDGDVIFPAVSKAGKDIFAFTTLGREPKLSKKVKKLIENVRKA